MLDTMSNSSTIKSNAKPKEIEYRTIAKYLASRLPDFPVEQCLIAIRKMNVSQKLALRSAYIFSSKAPKDAREDLFQELSLKLLEANQSDEKLCYAIARCDWQNWWSARYAKAKLQFASLDKPIDDGETTLSELLIGETEFEAKQCDKLDAQTIYKSLPDTIKAIVSKRLQDITLTGAERVSLHRFATGKGAELLAHYKLTARLVANM